MADASAPGAPDAEEVRELLAKQSIRELLHAYSRAVDRKDFALLATLLSVALAGYLIDLLTTNAAVREPARDVLPLAALAATVGVPAWLLDGVFIGATQGRALRNAAILATLLYIATDYVLRPLGAQGVWLALLASYFYRAGGLACYLPRLFANVAPPPAQA